MTVRVDYTEKRYIGETVVLQFTVGSRSTG